MVVPNRDLANTYFLFDFSLLYNPQAPCSNMAMDIDIDMPRGWSVNSSANSSIEHVLYRLRRASSSPQQ